MTGEGGAGGNEVIPGYISLHTSKEKKHSRQNNHCAWKAKVFESTVLLKNLKPSRIASQSDMDDRLQR